MTIEISDFVFSNHIIPVSREDILSTPEFSPSRFSLRRLWNALRPIHPEELERRIAEHLASFNKSYPYCTTFFEEMGSQNYCKAEYHVEKERTFEQHTVHITGQGEEIFHVQGQATFPQKGIIQIPVRVDLDQFNLYLLDPAIGMIPTFGTISVFYQFKTHFSLGASYSPFTDDLHKRVEYAVDSDDHTRFWHGRMGRVTYRSGDAFTEGLMDSIFAPFSTLYRERLSFNMQANQIYGPGGTPFYQGRMESDGTFPFYIRRNRDLPSTERMRRPSPQLVVSRH